MKTLKEWLGAVAGLTMLIVLSAVLIMRLSIVPTFNSQALGKHNTESLEKPTLAGAAGMKNASRVLNRTVYAHKALQCLDAICDTGASDEAISHTRSLIRQLGGSSQTFARSLSALLTDILSYLNSGSDKMNARFPAALIAGFRGIPDDTIHRAAASCYERGRMRPDEIVLSFTGDCTFGTVNGDSSAIRFPSVYRKSGRLDYPFAYMKPWFLNDDLTIVNYEGTLTEAVKTAHKQWHFKGAAEYAAIFPAASVEVAGLSNNHSFDYLDKGFHDTIANFRNEHVGVFYRNTPYATAIKGVETIIIGDCSVVGENTTVTGGVAERVINQIRKHKKPGNIVIVVMHWGSELDTVLTKWQRDNGRKFIDAGADAVVGHHPHVIQGIEHYKGRYIAYSLGNFAFSGNSLVRHPETFVFRLRFRIGRRGTGASDASIVPCRISSSRERNKKGVLRNNYQPQPVFGREANRTAALLLRRSAMLEYGVRRIKYFRQP